MKKLHKIGAYLRVSTDKQVQVFEGSLDTQKYRMQEFIKMKNLAETKWGDLVDFYVDEGYSAGTDRRPEYQRLMKDIREGRINLILISDLSRLCRSVDDFCALDKELQKYNATFFSMKEQFDTSTPSGRVMVNLMISLGQFEREQVAERVAINCNSRALRGFLNGGRPPLGYSRHPDKKGTMVVNEEESSLVVTIFKTFIEQGTRSKTIQKLHEIGIYPKRNIKKLKSGEPVHWTVQSLGGLLGQYAYIGLREVNKIYQNDEQSELKPWQQYKLVKASWPAILDENLFYEAQKILTEAALKERERLKHSDKKPFILSHLLTCGECQRALVGQSAKGKSGKTHRYYYHSRKFQDSNCHRPRLHADALEEKFINHLRDGLEAAGYHKHLEKMMSQADDSDAKALKNEIQRIQKELTDVQTEISGVWRLQRSAQMSEESLKTASEQLNELSQSKAVKQEYLAQLQEKEKMLDSVKTKTEFVHGNLKDLVNGWNKSGNGARKRLLRRAVKRIVVTKEQMLVTFWMSAAERDGEIPAVPQSGSGDHAEIIEFRRRSRLAASESNHNLSIGKLLIGRIGRLSPTTCNLRQVHDFIEIRVHLISQEYPNLKAIYEQGYSINEIANQQNLSYSTTRDRLARQGVTLRPNKCVSFMGNLRQSFKNSTPSPYGFCYLEGRLQKDPREFPTFQIIEKQTKLGRTPTEIATYLNGKKLKTRKGVTWRQAHVFNIVQRIKTSQQKETSQ